MRKLEWKYGFLALGIFIALRVVSVFFPSQGTLNYDLMSEMHKKNPDTLEKVTSLIEKGADVDHEKVNGNTVITPLKVAAMSNSPDLIHLLIKSGSKVNKVSGGTTALDFACDYKHKNAVKALLAYNAKRNSLKEFNYTDNYLIQQCKAKKS